MTQINIEILNAAGAPMETWTLNQPFIKAAKFGDLDYSSEDLRTVDLTIRYDWATCEFGAEHPDAASGLTEKPYFVAGTDPNNAPDYEPNLDNSQPVPSNSSE